eukprot:TRINITY_DN7393_c0_g1_i1.p1 TRINITY_DN7393_c0_g1~~TRINITY_DN7393_c0_g1_i1.p1  ORF type:complete len:228 (-),score=33.66 TRINITY_DN7393_c0_g1_i1:83-766(-)
MKLMRLQNVAIAVLVTFCFIASTTATLGVDISGFTCNGGANPSTWSCLKNNGYSFAIIQAWEGGYQFTANLNACVKQAWAAGMAHVDVYMFICPNCRNNNPENAVATVVNSLRGNGTNFGMLWFDVEQCTGCWNDNASNQQFLQRAINQAAKMGVRVGIYSNLNEWAQTVGSGFAGWSNYPLWYAHYDNQPNFNDQTYFHFGGWTSGAIKQFYDHGPCMNVDVNWYP